mgnify:CR=1 FL=1
MAAWNGTGLVNRRFQQHTRSIGTDLRLLPARDRAIIRIVNRNKAATTLHVSAITRCHPRKAQQRMRTLWREGYLERTNLPPPSRGGSPHAYRLTRAGRRRLGYLDYRTAGTQDLQHRLDALTSVCALAREYEYDPYPAQAWLTESMAHQELGGPTHPDAILTIQVRGRSAVLCLEIDEETQHGPVIGNKLRAYRSALADLDGWHLLFVVPTPIRRDWLRRQAAREAILANWSTGWITELGLLEASGLGALAWPLGGGAPTAIADLVSDSVDRSCPTPVGSSEWLHVLASGGGEDFSRALR